MRQRDLNEAEPLFEHISHAKDGRELVQLAAQLIDRQTSAYDPADLEDRYETRLRAMLDAKIQGQEIHEEVPAPAPSNVIDLMAALRKSLGDAPKPVETTTVASAPVKAPAKRAQKAAEEQRKQPGLKLPIEGGKKGKETAAPASKEPAPASRTRRRA